MRCICRRIMSIWRTPLSFQILFPVEIIGSMLLVTGVPLLLYSLFAGGLRAAVLVLALLIGACMLRMGLVPVVNDLIERTVEQQGIGFKPVESKTKELADFERRFFLGG